MLNMLLKKRGKMLWIFPVAVLCLWGIAQQVFAEEPVKSEAMKTLGTKLTLPGEVFSVEGRNAFLIMPVKTEAGHEIPWIWYAPTFVPRKPGPEEKWMFQQFLDAGIAIAGIDVGESYGSPKGRTLYSALYNELVQKRGFAKKACMLARSRGGLMLYNWAAEHPSSVACIAGIYPVGDLRSYPGLKKACGAYDMTEEQLAAKLAEHNPIDRLEPLAKAHVPIYHIHGDSDLGVPLEKNSAELEKRYRQLGGEMTLNIAKGQGHSYWTGFFQCQELVDFVIKHAQESIEGTQGKAMETAPASGGGK